MNTNAVKIAVIESEAGWGRKIDDWMVCLTVADALAFKEEFNASNTQNRAPDIYWQCEGEPELIELTEKQYHFLSQRPEQRQWLSSLMKHFPVDKDHHKTKLI